MSHLFWLFRTAFDREIQPLTQATETITQSEQRLPGRNLLRSDGHRGQLFQAGANLLCLLSGFSRITVRPPECVQCDNQTVTQGGLITQRQQGVCQPVGQGLQRLLPALWSDR